MEAGLFKMTREEVEDICRDLEGVISKNAVRETEAKFEAAENLMRELRKEAEGEVQERSVWNMDQSLEVLRMKVDRILDRRDAGKKGDGNVALKCTWNDRGYKGPCSDEAYRFNVSEGRAFCSLPKGRCRKYTQDVSLEENPCYESIALREMYFGAGWDHSGVKERPRTIHHVKEGRIAVLTTRPPGTKEGDRLVIGCLLIHRVLDDPGEETKIFGDKARSMEVPFDEVEVHFWDYYKNPEAEDVILWASGLFRYISNQTVLGILKGIERKYEDTGRDTSRVRGLIGHVELFASQAGAGSGATTL